MFLEELREKQLVEVAIFLVDSVPWLQATLSRNGLRLQQETHGNRNSDERVSREDHPMEVEYVTPNAGIRFQSQPVARPAHPRQRVILSQQNIE